MLTKEQKEISEALYKAVAEATKTFKELRETFVLIAKKLEEEDKVEKI